MYIGQIKIYLNTVRVKWRDYVTALKLFQYFYTENDNYKFVWTKRFILQTTNEWKKYYIHRVSETYHTTCVNDRFLKLFKDENTKILKLL